MGKAAKWGLAAAVVAVLVGWGLGSSTKDLEAAVALCTERLNIPDEAGERRLCSCFMRTAMERRSLAEGRRMFDGSPLSREDERWMFEISGGCMAEALPGQRK